MSSEPYITVNSFTSYSLTEKQALEGAILTTLQKQCIQNLLATNAEEKLRLEFDVANPESFIQQEAYKKGTIDILQYLVDASEAANIELNRTPNTIIED